MAVMDEPTATELTASRSTHKCVDPQTHTVSPTVQNSPRLRRRVAYLTVVAVILAIYSYPAVRTALTTKSLRLPAVSAPDLGLYLSLSQLKKSGDGQILNPYYHIGVPYPISYLKFRLAPSLFGLLDSLFGGRIWWTLFIWNLLCWSMLCLAAIWLFRRFLPNPNVELVLAAVSLLTLFSLDGFGHVTDAWIHSVPMKLVGGLPYIRPFSPQFIMPLFLFYVGLQIRAVRERSMQAWGAMAIVQFVAFTAFPYATLMMAGTTTVAAIWYILAGPRQAAWRVVVVFMLACGLPDIAFALHGSGGSRISFPGEKSLIKFQPFVMYQMIGKLWLLTMILVLAVLVTRKLRPDVKWPLVGLGLSTLLLKMGDAVVSEHAFFLSDHIGYFYQPTIIVLFIFLVSAYLPSGMRSLQLTRIVLLATVVLCCVYGLLMAEGNYRANLAFNLEQTEMSRWFARGEVSAQDLVITGFETTAYDNCEWIPLLSEAEVLYCRNAQLALTPEQNGDVQRLREVLYMYFDGKDHLWLENSTHFERYGLYGDLSSYRRPEELAARIVALRNELHPFFDRIESNDPSIRAFFHRFRRVWIIQSPNHAFVKPRLESYLNIKDQETTGSLLVISSEAK
jgi:hypothetical protein